MFNIVIAIAIFFLARMVSDSNAIGFVSAILAYIFLPTVLRMLHLRLPGIGDPTVRPGSSTSPTTVNPFFTTPTNVIESGPSDMLLNNQQLRISQTW